MASSVRLRTLLALTVLAITTPFVVFGGRLLYLLWQRQRAVVDRPETLNAGSPAAVTI